MTKKQVPGMTREAWLEEGVKRLAPIFAAAGHPLPPVKVSCSWPGGGSAKKRIGECWARKMSAAGINEIFISPRIADPVAALDILAHELVHAVDDCQNGHKAEFKAIGTAVGLEGKPTQMHAGEELKAKLAEMAKAIGTYPHSTLDLSSRKKAKTYLLKCECMDCDAVWRMTQSWTQMLTQCPCCGSDNVTSE